MRRLRLLSVLWPLAACSALTPPGVDGGTGPTTTAPPVKVSIGQNHVCTTLADGSAYCWGRALGIGSADGGRSIRRIGELTVRDVHAAEDFSCALLDDNSVRCWGSDFFTMLGDDSTANAFEPVAPVLPQPLSSLSSFGDHTCGATATGEVYCWGLSAGSECGVATTSVRTPTQVAGVAGAVAVRAGSRSSWAVLDDGGVQAWGYDLIGTVNAPPHRFALAAPATAVSANLVHACALERGGQVECWGRVKEGALGFDGGTALSAQGMVQGLSGALTVCAGKGHSCASFEDGGVACWGDNTWGQLGTGNYAPSVTPVPVLALPEASSVACGDKVSCAVTVSGLYCWGDNYEGQLGDSSTAGTNQPLRVPMP